MSLQGYTQIDPLNQSDLMSVVVDRINENSSLTNAILSENLIQETILENIGNTAQISMGGTLVEQSNFTYSKILELSSNQAKVIEFLPTDPMREMPEDMLPPFYFNTTHQTLMVYHQGEDRYIPSFGCFSVMDVGSQPASDWIIPDPIFPPIPPIIIDSDCYVPNPILGEGGVRKIFTFPSGIDVLSAETIDNITYIVSKDGSYMNLYAYNIKTNTFTFVADLNFYRKEFSIVIGASGAAVFIVGGKDSNGYFTDTIFGVDVNTGVISQYAAFPVPFTPSDVSYNSDGTKAYFFGGGYLWSGSQSIPSNKIYEMDTLTGAVIELTEALPIALIGASSTRQPDSNGLIYIVGGRTSNNGMNSSLSSSIFSFNPLTREIDAVSNLPQGRSDGIVYCGSSELYYVGGYSPKPNNCIGSTQDILRIFPYGNSWSTVKIGTINTTSIDVFGSEIKDCGYATLISRNRTLPDELFIIGI